MERSVGECSGYGVFNGVDDSDYAHSRSCGIMMEYEWESELEELLMYEYPELYEYFYGG